MRAIQRLLPLSESTPASSVDVVASPVLLGMVARGDESTEGDGGGEEVDPTDIDADKDGGPQWPWKRFYGSARETKQRACGACARGVGTISKILKIHYINYIVVTRIRRDRGS